MATATATATTAPSAVAGGVGTTAGAATATGPTTGIPTTGPGTIPGATTTSDTATGTTTTGKKKDPKDKIPPQAPKLSANELERVTEVFKMYETGLREATIYPKDLLVAMKALGLNPTETEIQDLINEVERNGFIYYPAFCRLVMRKLREDDEENFRRELFRTMVGPKKYDGVQAPIYNYGGEFLTFEQFRTIMMSLPEYVDDEEVKNMFAHADKDGNGYISYKEFTLMCKVPDQEVIPTEMPTNTTSNGLSSISGAATSVATSVINAVNGALKGAAVSSANQASNNTSATSTQPSSVTPVNTVVTVTTTKS